MFGSKHRAGSGFESLLKMLLIALHARTGVNRDTGFIRSSSIGLAATTNIDERDHRKSSYRSSKNPGLQQYNM